MSRAKAIDTHVHFWEIANYGPYAGWFGDKTFLERDYLPPDLEPHLSDCRVESAIIVGAAPDSHEQNCWYGELAKQYDSVCAVVGSYTFENEQLTTHLDELADKPWFVGIRTRPASPPDLWLEDANARQGMAQLRRRELKLDILVDHTLLPAVTTFAAKYDDVPFILNHCGLPPFSSGDLSLWSKYMRQLAELPNLFVKYSSFFLHCYPNCNQTQLKQAAALLLESFGTTRLLWGSNWPPELIGGTYQEAYTLMMACAGELSDSEYNQIFRENAQRVYGMDDT